jgi:hypothetical protein
MTVRATGIAALSAVALCACHPARDPHAREDHVNTEYTVLTNAAGASRLYAAAASASLVAEHRDWLHEAFHERAAEVPGLLKLLGPDGTVQRTVSGWALGGPLANGEMAWVEEAGEEYRYRTANSGGRGSPLTPPDDYWMIASGVGHVSSPLGAVVLWRPARGTSSQDPASRREELWIASIDRATGGVLKARELSLTLPWDRTQGVLAGGPAASPILLLVGLPDPGGPAAYRIVGLRLPTLEVAWEAQLDVASAEANRAKTTEPGPARASIPLPSAPHLTGADLRTLYSVMGSSFGDGSGWLLAHGGLVGRVLVTDLSFLIGTDGKAVPLHFIHLPGTDQLSPILDGPGVLLLSKEGARREQHFVSIDAIWPGSEQIETLADARTNVQGRTLGSAPDLVPMSAALRRGKLYVAPQAGGELRGAESADVQNMQTTPMTWHRSGRPRVRARQQWLEEQAKP